MFRVRVKPGLKPFACRFGDDKMRMITNEWSKDYDIDLLGEFIPRNPSLDLEIEYPVPEPVEETPDETKEAIETGAAVEETSMPAEETKEATPAAETPKAAAPRQRRARSRC